MARSKRLKPAYVPTPDPEVAPRPDAPAPHDLTAEAAVLSCVLLGEPPLTGLRPEDFYSEAHRQIYAGACAVHATGQPVDVVQVGSWLKDHGRIDQVGGLGYLAEVLNVAPAISNVGAYADTVRRKAAQRRAIGELQFGIANLYASNGTSPQLMRELAGTLTTLADTTATVDRVEWVSGAQLDEELPPPPMLCADLGLVAGAGAPHMLAGFAYSGKTLACQSLLLSLALGRPVWGAWSTPRSFRVAHVDLEQGRRLTLQRYQRLARGMGLRRLSDCGDALAFTTTRLALVASDRDEWLRAMTDRDLILVDSFRAATVGGDENDSSAREGLDLLGELSERTGCRALVVHHMGKPAENRSELLTKFRGSSGIVDALDCAYGFQGQRGEPIECGQAKARSLGVLCTDFVLQPLDVEGPDGDPRWGLRVQLHGVELLHERRALISQTAVSASDQISADKIRRALTGRPEGLATHDLRAVSGLSGAAFHRALLLLGPAVVCTHELTGRTTRAIYRLAAT